MKQKVLSIRDSKAEIYNVPFFARTIQEATRNFKETINNPQAALAHKYPEDYSLWLLGEYDDQTGEFSSHPPTHVINGIELRDQSPNMMPTKAPQEELRLTQ